jgi:hypothetical protein
MLRLHLGLTFVLIQQIRLAHALAESGFEISVPPAEAAKFSVLRERFGLEFAAASVEDVALTPFIAIAHETPSTAVGALSRPLIFPRAIVDHCRRLWPETRPLRYSFAGLVTAARQRLLDDWIARHEAGARAERGSGLRGLVGRQLVKWRGHDRQRRIGDVTLWSSERGRRFPTKAWDDEYYDVLSSSQFVLCPSGDFVWSYRFFEATLCGAIPIVEQGCAAYDGFRFRFLTDAAADLEWSAEDALHNHRLCCERLVLPRQALDEELGRLVRTAAAVAAGPAERRGA